jgi:hypothetical protein
MADHDGSRAPARTSDRDAPALKIDTECPSCHRRPAVVFYAVYAVGDPKDARLVCLECCPKVRQDS